MALLEVKGLTKYFGGLAALKTFNFYVEEGEFVGVIGPNGSGKTTLFNCITNFYPPTSGRVIFKGRDITKLPTFKISRMGIARTFQIPKPFPDLTVLENVMAGAIGMGESILKAREKAEEILKFLGMEKLSLEPAGKLNVHGRKLLELARALATSPKLLLLDEVAAGLNPTELDFLIDCIRKIWKSGVTIVMVEHVMKTVMTLSQRIVVLHQGEKIAEGPPEVIANDTKVIEAYLGRRYAPEEVK
ncbi:MAG: ABC transporter ATP-binding protein [Candidatus Bathyarchaeia archaeon]